MNSYSDIELLGAVNERAEGSYKVLHRLYFRAFFVASVRITCNNQESEDIVNETFIHLYTRYCNIQFETLRHVFNYMLRATKNRSINYVLHSPASREVPLPEAEVFEENMNDFATDALELRFSESLYAIRYEKAMETIESLPYLCIEVVRMVYFERLTTKEIALKLELQPQTVLNHKTKGLAMLAKILKEEDLHIHAFLIIIALSNN